MADSGAGDDGAAGHAASAAGGDAADAAWEAGRSAHPEVDLPRTAFLAALSLSRGGAPPPLSRAADCYLAAACAEGIDAAWETLRRDHLGPLAGFLRSRGASAAEATEALDALPGHLFEPGAAPGAPRRIATFRGESALFTWLAVVALRLVRHARRSAAAARAGESDAGGVPAPGPTPLQSAVGRDRAARLEAALREAFATLTPRESLAVRLRYREGLPQKEIAALLGVGEPRVTRLLRAGVGRLREEVERRVRETPPGGGPSDVHVWRGLEAAVREEWQDPGGTRSNPG